MCVCVCAAISLWTKVYKLSVGVCAVVCVCLTLCGVLGCEYALHCEFAITNDLCVPMLRQFFVDH